MVGASIVSLSYLGASYMAQGAFKEPLQALILIAFAVLLAQVIGMATAADIPDRKRLGRGVRPILRVLPLAVLTAASVFNYSLPGLLWIGAVSALVIAARVWVVKPRPKLPSDWKSRFAPYAIGMLLLLILATIQEWSRIADFAKLEALNPERFGSDLGNLKGAISPLEALGIWPTGDYRTAAANAGGPTIAFYALAAVRPGGARGRLPRRPQALALRPAGGVGRDRRGLGADGAVQHSLHRRQGAGDRLATGHADRDARRAPRPRAGPGRARRRLPSGRLRLQLPRPASGFGRPRRPRDGAGAVAVPSSRTSRSCSLVATTSSATSWRARARSPGSSPTTTPSPTPAVAFKQGEGGGEKFDVDALFPQTLDSFDWIVATKGGPQSSPPPRYMPRAETDDYILYERTGSTGKRKTLEEGIYPGAVLDCRPAPARTWRWARERRRSGRSSQ